jgi:hypothetical protein
MPTADLLISAPIDARSFDALCVPVNAVTPFQILLGWDAHIARFNSAAEISGVTIHFVAAPEVSTAATLFPSEQHPDQRRRVHLRFGTPRLPRLLRGAINLAVVTEDFQPPTTQAYHPFARGDVFPQNLAGVLADGKPDMTPRRIDGTAVPMLSLPSGLSENGPGWRNSVSQRKDPVDCSSQQSDIVLQSVERFYISDWKRRNPPERRHIGSLRPGNLLSVPNPVVLVPWNLANPGSIVPDLLMKIIQLSEQRRCPVNLVILPYNDVSTGLQLMEQVIGTLRSRLGVDTQYGQSIIFARAWDIDASLDLVARCHRVWIDATDPEWRWTTRRFTGLGLAVNFVSQVPGEYAHEFDPGPLCADEEILVRNFSYGPLVWRSSGLSLRRLAALVRAVARDEDVPLRITAEKNALPSTPFDPIPAVKRAAEEFGRD